MEDKALAYLRESLELAGRMLDLAERGVAGCQDDGCLVVYGIMRDCAYRIRTSAEKELQVHAAANRPEKPGGAGGGSQPLVSDRID